MAVDSASVSKRKGFRKERRKDSKSHISSVPAENAVSSPAKRNKSPGIRVVGCRIYDSVNGKTCHQCRQKTRDFVAACTKQWNNKPCPIMFCHKCLLNRYGEKAEEVSSSGEWSCPKCRGICNCSVCMKKGGHQPTGMLINAARATGFSSVSEMLLKGADQLAIINASSKKEAINSPQKLGKENSFDGKLDVNLPNILDRKTKKDNLSKNGSVNNDASSKIFGKFPSKRKTKPEDRHLDNKVIGVLPKEAASLDSERKSKKMKRDRLDKSNKRMNDRVILKENDDRKLEIKNSGLAKKDDEAKTACNSKEKTSPRKLTDINKIFKKGESLNTGADFKGCKTVSTKEDNVENKKRKKGNEQNLAKQKNVLKLQEADLYAEVPLPLGSELRNVAGIDVCAEDVGNALQFLEFCAVFGKVIEVKKGQPEHVLQDLLHGRTGRKGKFSLTVQFHIQLLSFILADQGEDETPSLSYARSSWFHALKKCLSEFHRFHKEQSLESLDKAADYEGINASEKLRLLNHLCDIVLETGIVRKWMNDQSTKFAEKVKEARQKICAVKEKEKSLKKKMQDDIAKAIVDKQGALSISEYHAIVSQIKAETAKAHAKVLESNGMLNHIDLCDVVRLEPTLKIFPDHVYWKLNCFGKSNILQQSLGNGEFLDLGEKWFAIDAAGIEAIEMHKCSVRGEKLRAARGFQSHVK